MLFDGGLPKVSNQRASETLEWMKTTKRDVQYNLSTAQQHMKHVVDKKKRTKGYKVGDEVVLSIIM